MKISIPAIVLALAGATAAKQQCTFAYRNVANGKGEHKGCGEFSAYLKADANVGDGPDKESTIGVYPVAKCDSEENTCVTESDNLGTDYTFCLNGKVKEDGTVDGDVTVQREGGEKVNLKPDGEEKVEKMEVVYWRGGIECEGAKQRTFPPAEPSGK